MGELVDFTRILRDRQLAEALAKINSQELEMPDPTELGWVVADDEDGEPTRYVNFDYKATIGYVPGTPEILFLDYRHQCMAWEGMTLSELAVGLEAGTLPDHDYFIEIG